MNRKAAITIVVIFLLVVAAISIRQHIVSVREARVAATNAAQLVLTRAEVPAQSNGFSLLVQAGAALILTNDDRDFAIGKKWDEARARNILETNAAAMALMHQAWALPYLQVEVITNMGQEFPYLEEWNGLAWLAVLEARMSFAHGDESKGFEQALQAVRFGQRVQAANGGEIHYTTGWSMKSPGLTCIREFANKTTLPASNLIAIAESLAKFEVRQDDLDQMLKAEYRAQVGLYDETTAMLTTTGSSRMKYLYDADRTKRELAAQDVSIMKAVTNYYGAGLTLVPAARRQVGFFSRLMHGNLMGETLNEMNQDSGRNILVTKCRENVAVRATRIILALKAYETVNHRPPASLPELVPGLLPSVPLDDFDGKPMRYKPESNLVYSVGSNLIDSGGVEGKDSSSGDILFPYHF